jgi:hypothetical protein
MVKQAGGTGGPRIGGTIVVAAARARGLRPVTSARGIGALHLNRQNASAKSADKKDWNHFPISGAKRVEPLNGLTVQRFNGLTV